VRPERIELPTSRSGVGCATNCAIAPQHTNSRILFLNRHQCSNQPVQEILVDLLLLNLFNVRCCCNCLLFHVFNHLLLFVIDLNAISHWLNNLRLNVYNILNYSLLFTSDNPLCVLIQVHFDCICKVNLSWRCL
jgi:hypothetical protein